MADPEGHRAKEDHPLSFQRSSCSNLSPLQHSAPDTDGTPGGSYNETHPSCYCCCCSPPNKRPDCSRRASKAAVCVAHAAPKDKRDYVPNPAFPLQCPFIESPPPPPPWWWWAEAECVSCHIVRMQIDGIG